MLNIRKFLLGLGLVPKASTQISAQGEFEVLSTDGKARYHNGTSASPVVTEAHAATLTNKTINGPDNTITNLTGSNMATNSAIAYSQLSLTDSIKNSDISSVAAIAYSKLNLALSIANSDVATNAAIAYSKLALTDKITNTDVSSVAAIAYSKLNLATSIVNADVATAAAIAYTKLNLTASIVNADIGTAAAIARTKIASGTANHVIINDSGGVLSSEASLLETRGGTHQTTYTTGDILYASGSNTLSKLPVGSTSYVLTVSAGVPSWAAATSGTGPRQEVYVTGGNAHGSTNNKIRRFVTTVLSTGSDITYADSATNGGTFTINSDGIYAIYYTDTYSNAAAYTLGISKNSAQLTTSIATITNANRLAITGDNGAGPVHSTVSTTVNLVNGDVIRAHTNGDPNGTTDDDTGFRITKVSN